MQEVSTQQADRGGPPASRRMRAVAAPRRSRRVLILRHRLPARLFHWFNVLVLLVMLGSGLQIFNAHPALYWGRTSHFASPVLLLGAHRDAGDRLVGITQIGHYSFDTTGVLGASAGMDGQLVGRGFPSWATLPGPRWLAAGRLWHLFFAWLFVLNGLAYVVYSLLGGHLRRDLLPRWSDLRHLGREIVDHARLRFPKGEAARHYNGLQKLAYLGVLFVVAPLIVVSGLTMSPTMDASWPWLLTLFGGRQSARTIHFICAFSFVGFFVVHIAMVLLSGLWNNLRSMITGRYAIEVSGTREGQHEGR